MRLLSERGDGHHSKNDEDRQSSDRRSTGRLPRNVDDLRKGIEDPGLRRGFAGTVFGDREGLGTEVGVPSALTDATLAPKKFWISAIRGSSRVSNAPTVTIDE